MPRKQTTPHPEDIEPTAAVLDDVEEPDEANPADELPAEPNQHSESPSFRDQVNAEFITRDQDRAEEQARCVSRYKRMLQEMPKGRPMDAATMDGLISAAYDAGIQKELMLEHLGVFERYQDLAQVLHETTPAQRAREMGEANQAMKALELRHKEEYAEARRRISAAMGLNTSVSLAIGGIDNLSVSYPELFEHEPGDLCPHLIGCDPIRPEKLVTGSA